MARNVEKQIPRKEYEIMFICWYGELMPDEMDEMEKLSEETLDLFLAITYDERKKFSNWFDV